MILITRTVPSVLLPGREAATRRDERVRALNDVPADPLDLDVVPMLLVGRIARKIRNLEEDVG